MKITEEQLREFIKQKVFKLESSTTDILGRGLSAIPSSSMEKIGFFRGTELLLPLLLEALDALEFYKLKSNYSVIDEGRNYGIDNIIYELDEKTYQDTELGTRATRTLRLISEKIGANE